MRSDLRKTLVEMFDKNMDEETSGQHKDDAYRTLTNTRNVCFIPRQGNAVFLNYAFLVSGEYDGDNSAIILLFTTHTVTIKGHNLGTTFWAFMEHIPRKLTVSEDRYRDIATDSDFEISDITIEAHET
jgi:hypothetical protein